jgi:type IV pilus assembly protein PilE
MSRGFTLVELMIVVAIIAILAAVALPSYNSYSIKSKRGDGKAALLAMMQAQEKLRANCIFYGTVIAGVNSCLASAALTQVGASSTSPDGYYNISLSGVSGSTYVATATPTFTDTECTSLIIDQDGTQSSTGTLAGTECWQ